MSDTVRLTEAQRDRVPPPYRVRPLAVVGASLRREWQVTRSYKLPFVMSGIQLVASVASFYFLSKVVGPGVDHSFGGQLRDGYFAFAVLGTSLLSIVSVMLTSFAGRLRSDQTTGTLEALLMTPSPAWLTVPAGAAYQLAFAAVSAGISIALAAGLFGLRFTVRPMGMVALVVLLLGAFVGFAALGVAFTGFVMVFKRGQGVIALVVTGLSLLGGVLYPLGVLPGPLRAVADWVPFTWALLALRNVLIDGGAPWGRVVQLWIAALVAVPISLAVFERALRRARRGGTLAQY